MMERGDLDKKKGRSASDQAVADEAGQKEAPRIHASLASCSRVVLLVLNSSLGSKNDPLGARYMVAAVEYGGAIAECHQERLIGRQGLLGALDQCREDLLACFISVVPGTEGLAGFVERVSRIAGERTPVVLGGVGARQLDVAAMDVPNSLLVVRGLGEVAAIKIIRMLRRHGYLDPKELLGIPNLTFSIAGHAVKTDDDMTAEQIDLVPSTAELAEAIARGDTVSLSTSTGCRGTCTFCGIRAVECASHWRARDPDIIEHSVRNLAHAAGRRPVCVDIVDDSLATEPQHMTVVADIFTRVNAETDAQLTWRASARADDVVNPRDTDAQRERRRLAWRQAVASGLVSVFVGIESGSKSQLRRFGKRTTPEINRTALDELRASGLMVEVGFIFLDPLMPDATWRDEVRDNLQMASYAEVWRSCPTFLSPVRIFCDSPLAQLLAHQGLLYREALGTGEFEYSYASAEVADFVAALGPVLSQPGPLRDLRRLAKVAQRYSESLGTPILTAVERLVRREINFVEELIDARTPTAVAEAQRAYCRDALEIVGDAAVAAASDGDLVVIVEAARDHLARWATGRPLSAPFVAVA